MLLIVLISFSSCGKNNNVKVVLVNANNDGSEEEIILKKNELLNIDVNPINGYTLKGIYSDFTYTELFDFSKGFEKNSKIYFLWDKNNEYKKMDSKVNIDEYINRLLSSTTLYIPAWNQEGFKGKWNYIDGVFLNSIVNMYKNTNDNKYKEFFLNYINYYINEDGKFVSYKTKAPLYENNEGFTSGELDTICESKILFDAYEMTNDNRYLNAIEYTYQELNKMNKCVGTTNYNHKSSYPNQIWLDGMYMYAPFLARYANYKNNLELLDDIKAQYEYIYNNMRNDNNLYYHALDTSKSIFWAKDNGCSESIWLRSCGWLIVSLTDVIEYYPNGDNKTFLIKMLNEAIENISKYMDNNSKMYYQLVDKGNNIYKIDNLYLKNLRKNDISTYLSNYLESSGSSMIAYSMMKSARLGYVDLKYQNMGVETFEGIYQNSFESNSLYDICITAGLGPDNKQYRDGSPSYYLSEPVGRDDAKGVGPFIMAYIEYNA